MKLSGRSISIKELISEETCMGTFGLVEVELKELDQETEALRKENEELKEDIIFQKDINQEIIESGSKEITKLQEQLKDIKDGIKQVSKRFKIGGQHHESQMNNNEISSIEKNRASYLYYQCNAITQSLEKLLDK